jgi:hypothetical protein
MVNQVASSHKEHGVIELFETYWVAGKSFYEEEMKVGGCADHYGFPKRSREDAQKLRRGEVTVEELWDDYLSKFQIRLAQELNAIRKADQFEQSNNE